MMSESAKWSYPPPILLLTFKEIRDFAEIWNFFAGLTYDESVRQMIVPSPNFVTNIQNCSESVNPHCKCCSHNLSGLPDLWTVVQLRWISRSIRRAPTSFKIFQFLRQMFDSTMQDLFFYITISTIMSVCPSVQCTVYGVCHKFFFSLKSPWDHPPTSGVDPDPG